MATMKVVSITQLKTQTDRLVRQVHTQRQPIIITRYGHPCAVLEPLSEDHMMMAIAKRAEAEMKAGRYISLQEFAKKHGLSQFSDR